MAPPKDPREALKRGDEIRVLFNRALPHPKYETGTGLRVQPYEPEFAARVRERFRRSLIAAYVPVATLVVLLLLLVAATRAVGPDRGRLRLLWLIPLVWLVPIGVCAGFQAFVAAAARVMDAQ